MKYKDRWTIADNERQRLTDALVNDLIALRAKADISQNELADMIGVSRQTYGSIERQTNKMSWTTYLSLVFFYDNNHLTHNMLRSSPAFPHEIVRCFNAENEPERYDVLEELTGIKGNVADCLDEKAVSNIRMVLMLELSRCTGLAVDSVIKLFDATNFSLFPNNETGAQRIPRKPRVHKE